MTKILTASGRYFDLLNPRELDVHIEDIAHALSHVCRFGGHCKTFYSVAQHSVHVSNIVPAKHARQALLHDATEAYIGDMVKPLKEVLPEFKRIEERLAAVIYNRFGLPAELHPSVKKADGVLLGTEQRDLMGNTDPWKGAEKPLTYNVAPLPAHQARELFLMRFNELWTLS